MGGQHGCPPVHLPKGKVMFAELEDRYVVFKRSDIKGTSLETSVQNCLKDYNSLRKDLGKGPLTSLVIERDWPEFMPTATALMERVEREELLHRLRDSCDPERAICTTDEELLNLNTSTAKLVRTSMAFEKLGSAMRGNLFYKVDPEESEVPKDPSQKPNRKHSHYFKDVSSLDTLDVYGVCDLFAVEDASGATQHAIKKLLLPGKRGDKSEKKDLQEAVDTLTRRIEMLEG
jgi:hypothetical protein